MRLGSRKEALCAARFGKLPHEIASRVSRHEVLVLPHDERHILLELRFRAEDQFLARLATLGNNDRYLVLFTRNCDRG